ncbi:MAG: amidohydrolase, partial [Saprospiraceae bacterium]
RKQGGDDELGFAHCNKPGIYTVKTDGSNLKFVSSTGENPRFWDAPEGLRIMVTTGGYLFGALDKSLRSYDLDGNNEKILAKSKYVNQWVPSPDGRWLAFTELHKAYVCAMPLPGQALEVSAGMSSVPVSLVSRDAGYSLHWSSDSKKLHYTLGDEYFTIELEKRFAFLPGAPDTLPVLDTAGIKIGLVHPSDRPEGVLIYENARIITMEGDEVLENGVLAVERNKIAFVGTAQQFRNSG